MKSKGSTFIAASTIITGLLTLVTGIIAWNFQEKSRTIDNNTAAVGVLQVKTAVNETNIQYIKQGVDDLKIQNKEILRVLKI